MDVSKETQTMNGERVGDLLKKINHAVKSSQHFRSTLSSLISTNLSPSDAVLDCMAKKNYVSSLNREGGVSSLQGDPSNKKTLQRRQSSSTTFTKTPDHDGFLWRKYGEKKIATSKFRRCYYRCTYYAEQSCSATKQVQQCIDEVDSPIYKVTYFGEHTCNDNSVCNTTNGTSSNQLDFSVTNVSSMISSLGQKYASSSTGSSVASSNINNPQMFDQSWNFGSMETDLILYEPCDMDELLSDYMSDL